VRRLVLILVAILIAVIALGCGHFQRALEGLRTTEVRRELHHKTSTYAGMGKNTHTEKRADALYDDDDDDDEELVGAMCPSPPDENEGAAPEIVTGLLAARARAFGCASLSRFGGAGDALGPSRGHRRPKEHPPRA
jgi:hypothetical protein